MELMEIPGYTENEKEHIAREHLIPKQMEINGIPEGKLVIQPAALRQADQQLYQGSRSPFPGAKYRTYLPEDCTCPYGRR